MSSIAPYFGDWQGVVRYVEPFAGALGSALNAGVPVGVEVVLGDANRDLVELYREVARDARAVEVAANALPTDEAGYYAVRGWDREAGWPESRPVLERAARTLYLNKRGFNGLYRTNRRGYFTTPWGRDPEPGVIDVCGHGEFIEFVQHRARLELCDWRDLVRGCGEGDVLYCDPPYVDLKDPKRDFGGYIGGFGWRDQVELRDEMVAANGRGARVVASNSWCEATRELYAGWNVETVTAGRHISSRAESRGRVSELLAWLPGR